MFVCVCYMLDVSLTALRTGQVCFLFCTSYLSFHTLHSLAISAHFSIYQLWYDFNNESQNLLEFSISIHIYRLFTVCISVCNMRWCIQISNRLKMSLPEDCDWLKYLQAWLTCLVLIILVIQPFKQKTTLTLTDIIIL